MRIRLLVSVIVSVVVVIVLGVGLHGTPSGAGAGSTVYRGRGLVLENAAHGPQLCLGSVAESDPPLCSGIAIANWDWSRVGGEQRSGAATWGSYSVVGKYDGRVFTLTAAPTPSPPFTVTTPAEGDAFATPCPAPAGGWRPPNPPLTQEDLGANLRPYLSGQPDFAGDWLDRIRIDQSEPGTFFVLNAAFTGDLARHRAELERHWPGPICVSKQERTLAELQADQRKLESVVGGQLLGSGIDEVRNVVTADVVVLDGTLRSEIERAFPGGSVVATPALTPAR
jgi:hypothetical protein